MTWRKDTVDVEKKSQLKLKYCDVEQKKKCD